MKKAISIFITISMMISFIAGFAINASADSTTTTTTTGPTQTILDMGDAPNNLSRKTTHTTTAPEAGTPPPKSTQLAFPGAEGFGQFSQGGRGGDIYYVTNLNDDGAGSLRNGVATANGPRTIAFAVSGTINQSGILHINKSNITIAGQTAPGGGITLRRYGLQIEASHVIVRYIRVRMGDEARQQNDCINIYQGENIIVDHVSSSWSIDENISIGEDTYPTYRTSNVTVQNSIISESLWGNDAANKDRSYGSLIRGSLGAKFSYVKNAYIHTARRIPRVGNYLPREMDPSGVLLDFRNNVIYNMKGDWSSYSWGDQHTAYNFVGNYLISGPETVGYTDPYGVKKGVQLFDDRNYYAKGYFDKNVIDGTVISNAESRPYLLPRIDLGSQTMDPYFQSIPFDNNNNVNTLEGTAIYDYVMSGVGASKDYDLVDQRILNDVKNKTGHYAISQTDAQVGGWPALDSGTAIVDSDLDGIPNSWETTKGLNPNNPNDKNSYTLNTSYTNLEVYLYELVPNEEKNQLTASAELTVISAAKVADSYEDNITLMGVDSGSSVIASVSSADSWITPSLSDGTFTADGSKTLSIAVAQNSSMDPRTGTVTVSFDKSSNETYVGASNITITVKQAGIDMQGAPTGLMSVDTTTVNSTDGKIINTTSAMEYRLEGDSDYFPVTGTEITGLAAGRYFVRYVAYTGYAPGDDAVIDVSVGSSIPFEAVINASMGVYERCTRLTLTNGLSSTKYSYAFSGTNVAPNSGWSEFVSADFLINLPVATGGNNRYVFLKAKFLSGETSYVSDGVDLEHKVRAPYQPPQSDFYYNGPVRLYMTYSSNAILGVPFALDIGLSPANENIDCASLAGTYDVGYYDYYSPVWTAFNKYSNGDFGTIGGRLPFYLASNAAIPVLRYSADGVIPASNPTYYWDFDLNYYRIPADRYSIFTQKFGKYELEAGSGPNKYKFTEETSFMKFMEYVIWVDRDLSTDTTVDSESKYAYQSDVNSAMTNKGQLFRDYVMTKRTPSNTFFTDADGKPHSDKECQLPFEINLQGLPSQYYYIAPINIVKGNGGNPLDTGKTSNFGIYYIAKDSSAFMDTEVQYGGAGINSHFIAGATAYEYPPQNIVQRYRMTELNAPQSAPTELAGVAPSYFGASDGKITGTTTDMEYRLSTNSNYTTATNIETTGLPAGTYKVRYAAKTGYNASPDTEVIIPEGAAICFALAGYATEVGTTVTIGANSALVNANGYFSIDEVLNGDYNVIFSRPGAITRTIPVSVSNSNIILSTAESKIDLILGDANDDDAINVSDLGLVKFNFNKTTASPVWDTNCDSDQNGAINVSDLGLVKFNFNKTTASYLN